MKKILLTLGSTTAVIAPIISVIACGEKTVSKETAIPADANETVNMDIFLTDEEIAGYVITEGESGKGFASTPNLSTTKNISITLSKISKLKNGEKIELMVKHLNVEGQINGQTEYKLQYTVNGLTDTNVSIQVAELMRYVDFTGSNGAGSTIISTNIPEGFTITDSVGSTTLSNGEDYSIKITPGNGYIVNGNGGVFSMTVTVNGLVEDIEVVNTDLINWVYFIGESGAGYLANRTSSPLGYVINDFNNSSTLNNGDQYEVEIIPSVGYTVNGSADTIKLTIEVEGLVENVDITIDESVLENFVSFSGENGSGALEISTTNLPTGYEILDYHNKSDLSNGGTYQVMVKPKDGYTINGRAFAALIEVAVEGLSA